jgi:hypothetical protein
MSENVRYDLRRPEVISEKFDDEYVIVNLKSGAYYGLGATGAAIWEMVMTGATHAEIVRGLAELFEAEETTLDRAVADLLRELEQEALVVPGRDKPSSMPHRAAPNPHLASRAAFTVPILEKHTDMQEVLQLDPIHEVDDAGWPSRKA